MASDRTSKVLFSMPKRSKAVRHYKQADCELVKIDILCHILGDVVLECITLDSDHEREEMMFRAVFNTAYLRSNILILNRDEIDVLWNTTDRFPKDFRAEVIFSEMGAGNNLVSVDMEEKDGLPMEAFAKVQEIFSDAEWLDPNSDVAVSVFNQITAANILQESLDSSSPRSPDSRSLLESAVSSYADPNSLVKKVDEPHLRVPVQRKAHSKIISPRVVQSPVASPVAKAKRNNVQSTRYLVHVYVKVFM